MENNIIEEQTFPALKDAEKYIRMFNDEERRRVVGQDGFVATRTIGQAYSIVVMGHKPEVQLVLLETVYALGYQKGIETAAKAFATSRSDGAFKALAQAILAKLRIGHEPK